VKHVQHRTLPIEDSQTLLLKKNAPQSKDCPYICNGNFCHCGKAFLFGENSKIAFPFFFANFLPENIALNINNC